MPEFLSPSVTAALTMLSPKGGSRFPGEAWDHRGFRITKSESPKAWFARVGTTLANPRAVILHDRIAMLGNATWHPGSLHSLCLQAVCLLDGTIEELLTDGIAVTDGEVHYFRLDVHPHALGSLYNEPIPHVHSLPHGVPRFPFQTADTKTLIPDFISFLFQNYAYEEWETWIEKLWKDNTRYPSAEDPLDTIKEAFRASQTLVLMNRFEKELTRLKGFMTQATLDASRHYYPIPGKLELLSL